MQGSIEYALLRLEEYRQRLKSHIIERYDSAVAAGALSGMAQAARIMTEFQRGEEICVQARSRPWPLPCSAFSGAFIGYRVSVHLLGIGCRCIYRV